MIVFPDSGMPVRHPVKVVGLSLVMLISLTVLQDFLHAYFNRYSFYLSESLLFKTFWLLFLPLFVMQWRFLHFWVHGNRSKIVAYGLSILFFSGLHLCVFPLLTWLFSTLFFDHTYTYSKGFLYSFSADFYKYVLAYTGVTIWFHVKAVPAKQITETPQWVQNIAVTNGRELCRVAVAQITYITAAAPYVVIHTQTRQYVYSNSLKAIQTQLNPVEFVRVHKSMIVAISQVVSLQSRLNGDYDLQLANGEQVRLSRNYSAAFKEVFTHSSA